MGLQFKTHELKEGVLLLELKGNLDSAVQDELRQELNNSIQQAQNGLIVSLDGVDFMDSSGIGALMRAWGEAENNGLKFACILKQPRLRKLLDTVGLLETLPNFLTVGDALKEWQTAEEREKLEVQPITPQPTVEKREVIAFHLPPTATHWRFELKLSCEPEMVSTARMACATFASQLGFGLDEIEDIKLAVSEACNNVVQHAYQNRTGQSFSVHCWIDQGDLVIEVKDTGKGTPEGARPNYGMMIIKAVMDDVKVQSSPQQGTVVRMVKRKNFMNNGGKND